MAKEIANLNIEEMQKASLQFGHNVSKLHPGMKIYVAGIRNNVHLIDLEKTKVDFAKTLDAIYKMISEGKTMLVVGTKVPLRGLVNDFILETGLPYVNDRWLGGTFTNFETILKRVNHYKDLIKQRQAGTLEKYTKKERLNIDKEIKGLEAKFIGIKDLTKLPEVVLVLDMKKDELAAREARKKGIKIVAICDTNTDPKTIDYLIPANDDAISSVKYILEQIKPVVVSAKQEFEANSKDKPKK